MSVTMTLILLAASLAAVVLCGWRGARPSVPGKVRMIPWRFLMLLGAFGVVVCLIHLVRGGAPAPPI